MNSAWGFWPVGNTNAVLSLFLFSLSSSLRLTMRSPGWLLRVAFKAHLCPIPQHRTALIVVVE